MSSSDFSLSPAKRTLSLRLALSLGVGFGIVLPALVLGIFQISDNYQSEIALRVEAPLAQYADVLSHGEAVAIWNVDAPLGKELVNAVMRNADVARVTVYDEHHDVFVRQPTGDRVNAPTSESDSHLLRGQRDIVFNGTRIGSLVIEMSTARVRAQFWRNQTQLALALLAQVCISFTLIWWLFNLRFIRPLARLERDAQRLAEGQLEQPLGDFRADEIGALARSLEDMRNALNKLGLVNEQKTLALQDELAERLRVEKELGFSQVKFAAIFEATPVPMSVSVASNGSEDYTFVEVNSAWLKSFAYQREAVIGSNGSQLGIWRNVLDRETIIRSLGCDGSINRYHAWMVDGAGGPDFLCEVSGRAIRQGQDALHVLAFDDITEKYRYEENILRLNAGLEKRVDERTHELSEALEHLKSAQSELVRSEKLSALGSLVAGIAHELNTPIGNSLTVATTLDDMCVSFEAEVAKGLTRSRLGEFVANTRNGAGILVRGLSHAAELVASFKQVAVDQTSLKRRQFSLREMLAEILVTLGPGLRKTTHTVHLDVEGEIDMDSFPGPLGQVVTNLVNNAVIHGLEGRNNGNIFIEARMLREGWVVVTFKDDGLGISPEYLGKVFDPFFTTKLGKGGSGLGLNIVYNLVSNSLGGSITVESPPGHGACFRMVLPLTGPDTNLGDDA